MYRAYQYALHNSVLMNSLIEMYCKCDSMVDARRLFDKMTWKDTVSWNSMISGYTGNREAFESLRLFAQMVLEGAIPDQVTFITVLGACDQFTALQFGISVQSYLAMTGICTSIVVTATLVDMYAKCGNLVCSSQVFEEIPEKNLVCWSAMISGYCIHGMGKEALSLFHEMIEKKIHPDEGVFTSVLSTCSWTGMVAEGKDIFNRMAKDYNVEPVLAHFSCMVDLLGRAGHLDEAYKLVETMKDNPSRDIWTALLNACRLHQNVELAEISAQKVFDINSTQVGGYICLSILYAAEKRWTDFGKGESIDEGKGVKEITRMQLR